jgi:hypothetical protein
MEKIMTNRNYSNLELRGVRTIPIRLVLHVGVLIGLRVLWGILPPVGFFWAMLLLVSGLFWMATYGWRFALREFRFWLDEIVGEGF